VLRVSESPNGRNAKLLHNRAERQVAVRSFVRRQKLQPGAPTVQEMGMLYAD